MNRDKEKADTLKKLRLHLLNAYEFHEKHRWGHGLSLLEMRHRYHKAFTDIKEAGLMIDEAMYGKKME